MILYELVYENNKFLMRRRFAKERIVEENNIKYLLLNESKDKVEISNDSIIQVGDEYILKVSPCIFYMPYNRLKFLCFNKTSEDGVILLVNIPSEFNLKVRTANTVNKTIISEYRVLNSPKEDMYMYKTNYSLEVFITAKDDCELVFHTLCNN